MIGDKNIFNILICFGIAVPLGVANLFLPSVLVSSLMDAEAVFIPVFSFQCLILLFLITFYEGKFTLKNGSEIYFIMLIFFSVLVAFFSLNIGGYLSYSLLIPLVVVAGVKYLSRYNAVEKQKQSIHFLQHLPIYLLPFYIVDLISSLSAFGLTDFISYMFATNGHSFVSFLMLLLLCAFGDYHRRINSLKEILFQGYQLVAFVVYLIGGLISQGRVAFVALATALLILVFKKSITGFIFLISLVLIYIGQSEKLQLLGGAITNFNVDDSLSFSSAISRMSFWETFFEMFRDNLISGAGGLAINIYKYDYNFMFNEFVDPHNEFIYLLAGFGLSGIFMLLCFIILVLKQDGKMRKLDGEDSFRLKGIVILIYLLICSLTNANSAKQNIELLIYIVLFFTLPSLSLSRIRTPKT